MITVLSQPTDTVLEFNITGTVTDDDYKTVLIPALEKSLETQDRVRMICIFDKDFSHYTLEALAQDARMGLKHCVALTAWPLSPIPDG